MNRGDIVSSFLSRFDVVLKMMIDKNEVRHLLVNATTRRDPDNKIVGVVGVA